MVNIDEQVLKTRKQIEEQKKIIEQKEQHLIPKKRIKYTPRNERALREKILSNLNSSKRELTKKENKFEFEVAKLGLKSAKKEIIEKLYTKIKNNLRKNIEYIQNKIQKKREVIRDLENNYKHEKKDYQKKFIREEIKKNYDDIEDLKERMRGWREGLIGSKYQIIKKFYSGYTSELPYYYSEKRKIRKKNLELKKQFENKLKKQIEENKQRIKQTYQKYGLNPLYQNGKIIGFEDKISKMTYKIENLGEIRPQILPELKKVGLINYKLEKIKEPNKPYQNIITGEILPKNQIDINKINLYHPLTKQQQEKLKITSNKLFTPIPEEKKESYFGKIKNFYTKTGKYETTTVDITDKFGNPTGQKAEVPIKELTKGELLAEKIKSSKLHKFLTKSQASERERKQWYVVHGIATAGIGSAIEEMSIGENLISGLISKHKLTTTGVLFHEPITKFTEKVYKKIPNPNLGRIGNFDIGELAKSSVFTGLTLSIPSVGAAYTTKFSKETFFYPQETIMSLENQISKHPGELTGFLIGTKLTKPIKITAGRILSGKYAKPKIITTKSGEKVRVIDTTSPDGKKIRILLQEKKYAASEKVPIQEQLRIASESKGERFFIHASPKPIKITKISDGKKGFEVGVDRGLYLAPESFLTESGKPQAYMSYLDLTGRTKEIGPTRYLFEKYVKKKKLKISENSGRKMLQVVQREYPNLPDWVKEALIKRGKDVSKKTKQLINLWANKFDKKQKTKTFYVPGKGNVNSEIFIKSILKKLNLNEEQLKTAKALYQYNIEIKSGLIGGPEMITTPHGPEFQLVEPPGKEFEKISTKREKILQKIGITRGKEYTLLDDNIIDISWFKEAKQKRKKTNTIDKLNKNLIDFKPKREKINLNKKRVQNIEIVKLRKTNIGINLLNPLKRNKLREIKTKRINIRSIPRKKNDFLNRLLFSPVNPRIIKPKRKTIKTRNLKRTNLKERKIGNKFLISRIHFKLFEKMNPKKIKKIIIKPKLKIKKKQSKIIKQTKNKDDYFTLPTALEVVLGTSKKTKARKKIYTGFEALRFY